ncbi:shadow of prion protein [Halichoerus grypus]|uniref:shadow of prion protein n=1 Tax=Halichoerus grypus TaxID=9711 RepID=UPI0016595DDF|nr:shadow of prion protein [Halichoerus grypus]
MSLRVCPPPLLGRRPRAKARLRARVQGLRHSPLLPTPARGSDRSPWQVCSAKMNWTAATCWALLLAATFLCDSGAAKGGRGGARGSARGGLRGGARGAPRVRVRPAPRYAGSSLRVAAAGAAGAAAGAAAGLGAGSSWRRATGPGERDLEDDEDAAPGGNRTGQGFYSYRAWTSGVGPTGSPCLCPLLGGALGALGLLRP